VAVTYDPAKRAKTLIERNLDFEDAKFVFEATHFETLDTRKDYGEQRILCYGMLRDRMVVVGGLHTAWRGSPCVQHEESQ